MAVRLKAREALKARLVERFGRDFCIVTVEALTAIGVDLAKPGHEPGTDESRAKYLSGLLGDQRAVPQHIALGLVRLAEDDALMRVDEAMTRIPEWFEVKEEVGHRGR